MDITNKIIDKIENGLRNEYFVKGDPLQSIEDMLEASDIPALSVAVIKGSELVWAKGYGICDKESKRPVDVHTLFQAASISKPLTALAVMKLVENGVLDLDTDINTYLKSWKVPKNEFANHEAVTIRNLLSHTAGTTVSGFPGYKIDTEIPGLNNILNGDSSANTAKVEVDMKPNTRFRYSGGGTTIIQRMLIDQLDKPFEKIMKELVLEPLGMKDSFYKNAKLNVDEEARIAAAHDSEGNQITGKYHIYPEMAAAGLWTTPGDLSKYVIEVQKSLMNESNKIISKASMEMMITPVLNGEYNLGLANKTILNEHLLGHSGGNTGYGCDMSFHKDKGYGVIIMNNSDNSFGIKMPLLRSVASVMNWNDLLNPELELHELTPDVMSLFVGRYKISQDKSLSIIQENNQLYRKSFIDGKSELNYVGENTVIDENRLVLFRFEQDKLFMNGREITTLGPDEKLACDYIEAGKIEEATKCYKDMIQNDPKISLELERKLSFLGYSAGEKGDEKTAIKVLKVALELYPESFICWEFIGEFYFKEKAYDLTIQAMEQSLKYNPGNTNAKNYIAKANVKLTK
jgi:CubicO group peptidase (beta-lactamase class C family)